MLERRRGSKQQDQHTDGVEHDLYGPAQTQANTSDRYDAVDSLPGAGERGKRKTGGKLAGLRRPSAFSSRRGSAATSQGLVEERTNSYYDRDAPAVSTVDNVLDHDLHATSPRLGGGFKRPSYTSVPRENAGDPLGVSNSADFLSHDLQRSSLAARDQGDTLERRRAAIKAEREPWAAQDERSRLVDASGDLDHRF